MESRTRRTSAYAVHVQRRIVRQCVVCVLCFLGAVAWADVPLMRGLEEVDHAQVELRGGFWGPRLRTHHEVTVPHALNCLEKDGHLTNFDKAARVLDGPLRGHHTFDSDLHKTLEGAVYSLRHYNDGSLRQRVEGILDRVLAAQQKDGFLIFCWVVELRRLRL
ncbi:MAG: glycoside hydrolase family 127 protein [Planctomycetota bacterium]|nr:glycoside hydrolase family 127 protein [Planctomycetota bacterium]